MTIDPRMAERRKEVAESRARVDLRRFLWVIVIAALVGGLAWLVTSPVLSVAEITVFGVDRSDPMRILAEQEVVEGRPLIAIRPGRVAEALQADPWVRAASVELLFPDRVEVTVDERRPVVWVAHGGESLLFADDGVIVDAGIPAAGVASADVAFDDEEASAIGERSADPVVLGVIEFVETLGGELAAMTRVFVEEGELWATVGEREVRIGRPIDMAAKASAVASLFDAPQPGILDVIAPTRPAIRAEPEPVPTEGEGPGEGAETGADG